MNDPRSVDKDRMVDPNVGEIIATLVAIVSSIDPLPTLFSVFASLAFDTTRRSVTDRLRPRWRKRLGAVEEIENGLGKVRTGLASLQSIPEVNTLAVRARLLGFLIKQTNLPQYKESLKLVRQGVRLIENGASTLLEFVHASAHSAPRLSEVTQDGQRLLAELSESLGLLSGKGAGNRERGELQTLLRDVAGFCDHVQNVVTEYCRPSHHTQSDVTAGQSQQPRRRVRRLD